MSGGTAKQEGHIEISNKDIMSMMSNLALTGLDDAFNSYSTMLSRIEDAAKTAESDLIKLPSSQHGATTSQFVNTLKSQAYGVLSSAKSEKRALNAVHLQTALSTVKSSLNPDGTDQIKLSSHAQHNEKLINTEIRDHAVAIIDGLSESINTIIAETGSKFALQYARVNDLQIDESQGFPRISLPSVNGSSGELIPVIGELNAMLEACYLQGANNDAIQKVIASPDLPEAPGPEPIVEPMMLEELVETGDDGTKRIEIGGVNYVLMSPEQAADEALKEADLKSKIAELKAKAKKQDKTIANYKKRTPRIGSLEDEISYLRTLVEDQRELVDSNVGLNLTNRELTVENAALKIANEDYETRVSMYSEMISGAIGKNGDTGYLIDKIISMYGELNQSNEVLNQRIRSKDETISNLTNKLRTQSDNIGTVVNDLTEGDNTELQEAQRELDELRGYQTEVEGVRDNLISILTPYVRRMNENNQTDIQKDELVRYLSEVLVYCDETANNLRVKLTEEEAKTERLVTYVQRIQDTVKTEFGITVKP